MPKIIGNTTATPTPVSDWAQTDPMKADYIKNKPNLDAYLFAIDYDSELAFDTTEIVFDSASSTTAVLGQAILGQLRLA